MGWTVRISNHGRGEIFHARPDRPYEPPSLLYKGNWVLPGGKAQGCGVDHPPKPRNEAREIVEIDIYLPPPPLGLRGLFEGKFFLYPSFLNFPYIIEY
jgi:hypothetical protein